MIKLNNLNKYFNRKKANEIHVINDISLTLPDRGLVVLLGPSGSGKTTLLNVLGGLDKVQNGSIEFEDQRIVGYNAKTWDKIRNKEVGYIFQNYNLLTNLTVYDNISLTLNMINIYDKEEIDKRVDYILDAMGMINYRKRRASQLSGGQQQRVAIARALAKNPKVIIADEPTGNLDSKNTQEIMSIIKKISQNKLVVLVTHEENIANFYADRVIKLQDGKVVSDEENSTSGSLDYRHETDIYLGDLRNVDQVNTSKNNNLDIYSDEDIEDTLDVKLIVKNKTIYIDLKSQEYQKVQLIESDSEINIYPGKYKKLQKETTLDSDFNLESIITENKEKENVKHSVITIKDSLKLAWNRIKDTNRLGKVFYFGFAAVAALIAVAVGMLGGILHMDPTDFLSGSEELVLFDKGTNTYDDIIGVTDDESINYLQLVSHLSLDIELPPIYQSYNNKESLRQPVVFIDYIDESKMVHGRMPNSIYEIVLDQDAADSVLDTYQFQMLGITEYADLMNLTLTDSINFTNLRYEMDIKIVGIVQDQAKVAYASKELIYMTTFNVGLIELFEDDITIEKEALYNGSNEIYIANSDNLQEAVLDNIFPYYNVDFQTTKIYTASESIPPILVHTEDIERAFFNASFIANYADLYVHSNNIEDTISHLEDENIIGAQSLYDVEYEEFRENRLSMSASTIIFAAVALGASAISYFFILRSSLLSRIYEVSVYRALGVSKNDIRKMFTVETVFITTITSMIGFLAATFLLYRIQLFTEDVFDGFIYISSMSIISGIVIVYVVNIIAGLIPVSNLLTKTPAEILSKYDF